MSVRLSNGAVRNGYTIRIVNKQLRKRDFVLAFDGLPASLIDFVGVPRARGRPVADRRRPRPDARSARAGDRLRRYAAAPRPRIVFRLTDIATGEQAEARDHFFGP